MLKGEKMSVSKVVRVAVSNNFNCTAEEFNQLDGYRAAHPGSHFFVNCNINTPWITNLNKHNYQVVLTINPMLKVTKKATERLYKLDKELVAFVRVKYLPNDESTVNIAHTLAEKGYKVVITPQRFNGFKTLDKYTERKYYHFAFNRMRLTDEAMKDVDALVNSHPNIYHCDRSGEGCSACMNCALLTTGSAEVDIASLNLSTSGLCSFNCVDCYAKTMQNFLRACEYNPIRYDEIKKNVKQRGATKHAQHAKKGH